MINSPILKSIVFLVVILMSTINSLAIAKELKWESVPITTIGDVAAGRAGGEGFQVVEDIVFAPSDPKIMYLSTNTSQVWKSIDSGNTWQLARKGFKSHGATSLAVDTNNPDIVFAAGTQGRNENFSYKLPNRYEGVYRTLDGGKSWKLVRMTNFNTVSNKGSLILIVPGLDDTKAPLVYAASHSEGLIKSDDLGDSWEVVSSKLHSISDIVLDYSDSNAIYIAAKEGLYSLKGVGLKRIGKSLPGRPLSIATNSMRPEQIFVSTYNYGVYHSTDGGDSFKYRGTHNAIVLESSQVNPDYLFTKRHRHKKRMPLYSHDAGKTWDYSKLTGEMDPVFDQSNEQFWFSSPFATHPADPNITFTVSNGKGRILKSTDAGKTWTYSGSGFTGGRMKDIAFLDDGRYLFALTDHGIWESTKKELDSFKYLPVPRVFGARSVSAIAVDKNIIVAAIGTWGKKALAVSTDFGKSWNVSKSTLANHSFIVIDPSDNMYIYASNFISTDQGKTWKKSNYSIRAIDKKGRLYALKNQGDKTVVIRSGDRSNSWLTIADDIPISSKKINSLAVSSGVDPVIYLATNVGVYVINSATGKWELKNNKNGLDKDDYGLLVVSGVVVDPKNSDIVYAARRSPGYGESNGIFLSNDGGNSWKNITNNLAPYLTVWSIKINPYTGTVYIGTSLGSFRLRNLISAKH